MSHNLKIALQENELVAFELEKIPSNANVFKCVGNICAPITTLVAKRVNKQRIGYITEQIKNFKE
jgi:chaperonin cofactor prefoldin